MRQGVEARSTTLPRSGSRARRELAQHLALSTTMTCEAARQVLLRSPVDQEELGNDIAAGYRAMRGEEN